MKVLKRNGWEDDFDSQKIVDAVTKANAEVNEEDKINEARIQKIANAVEALCTKLGHIPSVDEISDMVEVEIMKNGGYEVAQKYIRYRHQRDMIRKSNTTDETIFELIRGENEYWNTENSNKNQRVVTTQRDYIAGITSTDIARRFIFPANAVKAHDEGIVHIHDMDYMCQNALHNCELINLEDMLQNGTVINNVKIEKPHRIITASTIATQIILGVTSSSYGGATISLTHLAPFVRDSYNAYLKKYKNWGFDDEKAAEFAKLDTKKEVADAVQTFNYQVNSMTTTNGQAPFLSVFMYLGETDEYKDELAMLIEEFLNQRIQGFKNEKGVWVTPAFPKLLYVTEEDNIHEDSKYWYLTELAAKCTAKRMVPDYISEKKMKEFKVDENGNGQCYPCMGCRSFLTPYVDENGKPKYYGRFNCGVATINLPYIALASGGDKDKFWSLMDKYMELCHEALKIRYKRLDNITSDAAPILWQHGALARLKKGESIRKLVHNNYATVSLGYAGLYECVKFMTGKSHTDNDAKPFALEIMNYLNDMCNKWKAKENISYSVYGTPIESTTYKFAKALKKKFPKEWAGISGKDYITNSYHVHVTEPIDAFTKLKFESEFQKLSPGGSISYVEVPNMQQNIHAVLSVIKFIHENIMYAELNTKSDYCMNCGYDGEIQVVEDKNEEKLVWECPNCHNRDQTKMSVVRRTCGYLGSNYFNQGRTQEIKERVLHL